MSQNATVKIFCLFIRTFCLLVIAVKIDAYEVPPAIVEPLKPVGLRVSIPDHPGITLFAFHGNVNEDFENGREAGQMAVDILRKKNGFWTYTNRNIKLKEGDIIYYWLYVIQDGLGYERLFQSHVVDGFFPSESLPTPPSITKRPVIITTSSTRRPIITEGPSPTPVTDDIGIRRPSNEKCVESMTTVRGEKACSGYMIFESNFANGIGRNWTHEVHFNDNESEFVVFDNRVLNTFVESNYLTIKPALLDDYYGPNFAATASDLDLTDRCTSYEEELCKKDKFSFTILPPVISGRLTTKESFSFKYGIVEIKAKLPRGNWVVPEIWLQPKAHKPYGAKNSGKIVVAKSIGNTLLTHEGMSIGNNLLTAGLEVDEMSQTYKKTNAGLWSDRFHIYKLEWTPTGMRFNVDGEEFGKWVGKDLPFLKGYGPVSPFDQEFYLLLGIHAGGYFDVPDGAMSGGRPKPWRNTNPKRIIFFFEDLKNWHATWNDKTKLQIDYIRVWAL